MRRTLCSVNAADAGCVARGSYELVCAFIPSDRKIGHTVRSMGVYGRKLREATPYELLSRFTPKDRKIRRTVSSFVTYFELLDPEIERSEFDPSFFKNSALFYEKFTHAPYCRAYVSKYLSSSCCILKLRQIIR